MIADKASGYDVIGDPRSAVELYVSRHAIDEGTFPSLAILVRTVGEEFKQYGSIGSMPPSLVAEIRNDMYLVSTGTMTASGAGLQWRMVRNILLAWVFTLPAAMLLSGGLYWILSRYLAAQLLR